MADSLDSGYGMQNTGNPVLDSTVNIVAARLLNSSISSKNIPGILDEVHGKLLELADKEPGGLYRDGQTKRSDPPRAKSRRAATPLD